MKKQTTSLLLTAVCILALFTTAGCIPLLVGAAAGAGGVVYVKGNLEQNVDYSVERVHKATLRALKDMKLIVTNDDLTQHNAVVEAQFDDGKKVNVTVTALTERASNIKVRVGVLGDKIRAQSVMTAIENEL